ncbi:DUF4115 domain-containing protein [Gallaecimonas kandeliae]|uniref:RodZ domain-containing protein n=1 Tax=Gallaecimonas kandeliae TaxID=3029055 RepID=UPI0026482CA9|nr:RodZ domain-containing protein [Gallaecimonas kandeliae]WKE64661.1 DUF4115 domain-containing protein [Gallaecimonas kandeliae]
MAEPNDEKETLSAGQRLRQAREARGWSVEEVAKRLNLRLSVVEQLENDDYDRNSPATYTKGYIRAYCRLLDLPESEVMAELCADQLKSQTESNMQSFSRRTTREKSDSWLTLVTWLIGLAILGLLVYFGWQQATTRTSLVNTQAGSVQAPVQSQAKATEPEAKPGEAQPDGTQADDGVDLGTPVEEGAGPEGDDGSQGSPAQPQPQDTASQEAPAAAVPSPAERTAIATSTLEISFRGDCWVRIEDSTGKRVLEGVKKNGQSFSLQGQAPFAVKLGAPEVVDIQYQGAPVDLSGFKAGRLAKLTLPQN